MTRFGQKAKAAIPILRRWLDDAKIHVRLASAAAICQIDPEQIPVVVPHLIDGLERGVALDQSYAAETLGSLGEEGTPARSVLETLLNDDCAGVRCSAGIAIWQITGDFSVAISVGVGFLDADDWLDRYVGAEPLGCLDPMAASALWDLRRALDDEDPCVRATVEIAIERIERE